MARVVQNQIHRWPLSRRARLIPVPAPETALPGIAADKLVLQEGL